MSAIAENVERVKARLARAAQAVGRDPQEIELVVVTKNVGLPMIEEAIDAGITTIGENRVQEAHDKHRRITRPVKWHLVGHLQRNKVKPALEIFDMIHSVDSFRLAKEISRRARQMGKVVDILVQVNTSGEEAKSGLAPEETVDSIRSICSLEGSSVKGLMTIGAFLPDPEQVRPCFRLLRKLKEKVESAAIPGVQMKYLSMGMTNDFEVAVEEGANLVRIGTAIFGPRPASRERLASLTPSWR